MSKPAPQFMFDVGSPNAIVREAIDGRGGDEQSEMGDEARWRAHVAKIQAQADLHRS